MSSKQSSSDESLPAGVQVLRWPHAHPLPVEEVLGFFKARGLHPGQWSNGPGDVYGVHGHPYRKTLFCLEGSITFTLADGSQKVTLRPGDRLIRPPGALHGAVVGPEGVTCIEAAE